MKKIPRSQYNLLRPAEKEIINSLGIEIDDSEKLLRSSGHNKDSVLESYAVLVETTCKLCQTTATKVFLMEGTGGLLVSVESTISDIEGMTVKTRTESVLTCPACHDILLLMSTEDLIALTLRVAKGETRCTKRS